MPAWSGFSLMPRKMAGSAMITIDAFTVAASMPRVVFDSATHLYRSGRRGVETLPFADSATA